MTEIHGTCDERFAAVQEAFAKNFDGGLERGACFAAHLDGEPIVDLWAGTRDAAGEQPWERDTIVNVYSTTKAMAAITTLRLVDRGELDLDAPVSSVWPEFAANGKESVLVRHLLSHTSGLSGWQEPVAIEDLYDWDRTCGLLAAQAPWWEPGTESGYHAITQGFLLGEVVRRVTGRTLGTVFREEIAEPLGVDFHIGLDEQHEPRLGELVPPEQSLASGVLDEGSVAGRTLGNPVMRGDIANTRGWRAAEIPAANGQGNARAVATVAGTLACGGTRDGVEVLSERTLDLILEEQCHRQDLVLGVPIRWGLGFGLRSDVIPLAPSERMFFWGGWGGSLVVVDRDERLGFSYVMNKMGEGTLGDTRGIGLAMALYGALAEARG